MPDDARWATTPRPSGRTASCACPALTPLSLIAHRRRLAAAPEPVMRLRADLVRRHGPLRPRQDASARGLRPLIDGDIACSPSPPSLAACSPSPPPDASPGATRIQRRDHGSLGCRPVRPGDEQRAPSCAASVARAHLRPEPLDLHERPSRRERRSAADRPRVDRRPTTERDRPAGVLVPRIERRGATPPRWERLLRASRSAWRTSFER